MCQKMMVKRKSLKISSNYILGSSGTYWGSWGLGCGMCGISPHMCWGSVATKVRKFAAQYGKSALLHCGIMGHRAKVRFVRIGYFVFECWFSRCQ